MCTGPSRGGPARLWATGGFRGILHPPLRLADIQPAADHLLGEALGVVAADQRAGMAGRQLPFVQQQLHALRQRQQAQGIGDVGAALAKGAGEIFLRMLELVDEAAIALGLFKWGQVLPLDVLDNGKLEGFRVGERSEEHTSELQSLMRISYAVFCLKKKKYTHNEQK